MYKRKTLQLARRRDNLKNELVQKDRDLDRQDANPPSNTTLPGGGNTGGCSPCGGGKAEPGNDPCSGQVMSGFYTTPIEYLGKFKITYGDPDTTMNIETGLIGEWSSGDSFTFNVQNWAFTEMELHYWCTAYTGGEYWDIPAELVDNEPLLNADLPTGGTFWVRFRLEDDILKVRAWMDGLSEPTNWPYWVNRSTQSAPNLPGDTTAAYYYSDFNSNASPYYVGCGEIKLTVDGLTYTVEDFSRSASVDYDWGVSANGDTWVNNDPTPTDPTDKIWDTDGDYGRLIRTTSGYSVGGSQRMLLTELGIPLQCVETFSRVESSGWGTSEFGPAWQQDLVVGSANSFTVDGDYAIVEDSTAASEAYEFVDASSAFTLPIETLWNIEFKWNRRSEGFVCQLGLDGPPDPSSSTDYCYGIIYPVRTGGSGSGPWTYDIELDLESSIDGGYINDIDMGSVPDDDTYITQDFYVRMRQETGLFGVKWWKTSDTEPSSWTVLSSGSYNAVSTQIVSFLGQTDGDGVGWSRFRVNSVGVTDGCPFQCTGVEDGTITTQRGGIAGYIDGHTGTANGGFVIGLRVLGVCSRIDSTTYQMPSNGTFVDHVTVDFNRIEGWTFTAPRTITLPTAVDVDTHVYATYFTQ